MIICSVLFYLIDSQGDSRIFPPSIIANNPQVHLASNTIMFEMGVGGEEWNFHWRHFFDLYLQQGLKNILQLLFIRASYGLLIVFKWRKQVQWTFTYTFVAKECKNYYMAWLSSYNTPNLLNGLCHIPTMHWIKEETNSWYCPAF